MKKPIKAKGPIKKTHTVEIIDEVPCKFSTSLLNHVNTGDEVKFINLTSGPARISFSNRLIFDTGPILLAPKEAQILVVRESYVVCNVSCKYPAGTKMPIASKPEVIVNRD